jgi:hypothetical protein
MLVGKIDPWGSVSIDIECPYEFGEPRPCTLGMPLTSGERCDWDDYEAEKHHESCPSSKDPDAECSNPDDGPYCWPEEPEECDGFNYEGEHMHPVPGCWVRVTASETGWPDGIDFGKDPGVKRGMGYSEIRAAGIEDRPFTLPMAVHVSVEDGVVFVEPWMDWKARQPVLCIECGQPVDVQMTLMWGPGGVRHANCEHAKRQREGADV